MFSPTCSFVSAWPAHRSYGATAMTRTLIHAKQWLPPQPRAARMNGQGVMGGVTGGLQNIVHASPSPGNV